MEALFQQMQHGFLRITERVMEYLQGEGTYEGLQEQLRADLDAYARDVLQAVVEAVDERLREERQDRAGWVVTRRGDEKQVLSPFGMLRYGRTYFRHKATGRYAYLADEAIGVTPHLRVEHGVKAQLAEAAVEQSYRKSGRWRPEAECHVSAQTVMQALRETQTEGDKTQSWGEKRRVRHLYIEADEDHVPNQQGVRWQPRLVYVHEGWQQRGNKRMELLRPRYFGGLYTGKTQGLWEEVWRYLEDHYDLEAVEVIFVSGDGAHWIRQGCEYLPKSVFVLDRYHVERHLTAALGVGSPQRGALWKALNNGDARQMRRLLEQAYEQAESENRREAIKRAGAYFNRHWDGIRAWRRYEGVWRGCSAEGHVSHVYAARLSSRPMAWSRDGVETMARLRVLQANGGSAQTAYLHRGSHQPLRVSTKWLGRVREEIAGGKLLQGETLRNLPALRRGRNYLTRALRGLSDFRAV